MKTPEFIAHCARMASVIEVSTEKPGNVTPTKSFANLTYDDFAKAGERLEKGVQKAAWDAEDAEVGRIIYDATPEKKNVNFGIVMMFMPLAAVQGKGTKKFLNSLTPEDTKWIVKAMQKANLGGMALKDKKLSKYDILSEKIFDVIEKEEITPMRLMEMAQPYDTLAREWINDYPISRSIGRRILLDSESILTEYLKTLSAHPDTLIARKVGLEEAEKVSKLAKKVSKGNFSLEEFDAYLRSRGNSLNPGTTADLIATGLFLRLIA